MPRHRCCMPLAVFLYNLRRLADRLNMLVVLDDTLMSVRCGRIFSHLLYGVAVFEPDFIVVGKCWQLSALLWVKRSQLSADRGSSPRNAPIDAPDFQLVRRNHRSAREGNVRSFQNSNAHPCRKHIPTHRKRRRHRHQRGRLDDHPEVPALSAAGRGASIGGPMRADRPNHSRHVRGTRSEQAIEQGDTLLPRTRCRPRFRFDLTRVRFALTNVIFQNLIRPPTNSDARVCEHRRTPFSLDGSCHSYVTTTREAAVATYDLNVHHVGR